MGNIMMRSVTPNQQRMQDVRHGKLFEYRSPHKFNGKKGTAAFIPGRIVPGQS